MGILIIIFLLLYIISPAGCLISLVAFGLFVGCMVLVEWIKGP